MLNQCIKDCQILNASLHTHKVCRERSFPYYFEALGCISYQLTMAEVGGIVYTSSIIERAINVHVLRFTLPTAFLYLFTISAKIDFTNTVDHFLIWL